MHELVFAEQILACVQEQATINRANQVTAVHLRVGTLSGIDKNSLSFCLEAISTDTVMEGADIIILDEAGEIQCPHCGNRPGEVDFACICSNCGADLRHCFSREITIQEIELNVEEC